ncbi:MAG: translation elongation factor-like protein [Thermoplasmata archaeon]|nr:translation elongation factor-like protein [Candidatus Thermoplasmatota archaeon]MCK4949251.1 translation elongation factor-like protein [Thermoplasmata archaeon]
MEKIKVGRVFKYFAKPMVAAIQIEEGALKVGDKIAIQGATTDLTLTVESMEIDGNPIQEANTGQSVGIKVAERVRPNDFVYKVVED